MNLESEIRNGYLVDKETKMLWNVELEIFNKFENVCKKNNLKYFADGGTLLGAVRHKGFIPWDDDIDIQMLVEDFNILCKVAQEEFCEPYFFQYYRTEEGFPPWHVKIRRSDTTCYTEWEKQNNPMGNKGVFIDIFPLYNIPDGRFKRKKYFFWLKAYRFLLGTFEVYRSYKCNPNFNNSLKRRICINIWKIVSRKKTYKELCEKYISLANSEKEKTKDVSVSTFDPGNKRYIWPRKLFEKTIYLPFEEIQICCPENYDQRLKIQYGDYLKEVKGSENHSQIYFDVNTPYKENINKMI